MKRVLHRHPNIPKNAAIKTNPYNTNLAAEYYALSMLYRYGAEASLTLGNKKSVDIVVLRGRKLLSIDVKGLAGRTLWPLDNFTTIRIASKHSYTFALPDAFVKD